MTRSHLRHTVRVAAVATVLVMLCYIVAAIIVNLIVTNHLVGNVDTRLLDRVQDASQEAPSLRATGDGDVGDIDDAPSFLWSIDPGGGVTALTTGAPALPQRRWGDQPVSLKVHGSTFRFDSLQADGTTFVAGESMAGTSNVQTTLLVAEIVFGVVLALAIFGGAMLVGLRVAAPSEFVRRRQAEFTADASHELRTPISVIDAEVELALDRPRDREAYRDVLQRVGHESARLRRIVEDLLWLARADDAPDPGGPEELTDVAEVVEASAQRFAAVAETHGVTLAAAPVGAGPFTVESPRELLDRLAGVLIDNAFKFAGPHGQVQVSIRLSGNRVVLRVDDSGPGIPADQRDAVFDRFHRASDSAVGTGLGLAIADSVVRSTHGAWEMGVADLGGARMEVSWRRAQSRRSKSGSREGAPRSETFA